MARGTGARPTGIAILAVLAGIGGAWAILDGLGGPFASGLLGGLGGAAAGREGGFVFLYGVFVLVLGVAYIAIAYGFWTIKPWAYEAGVLLAGVAIALAILGLLLGGQTLASTIISIAIAGAIILYLTTPSIKAAFNQK